MTLGDRIEHALSESADSLGAPPSELESVILRGRRRRLVTRMFAIFGSGTALVLALMVTVAFTRAASEPEAIVGEQTEATLIETTATATETRTVGHLAQDTRGYRLIPEDGSEPVRLYEAHTTQAEGDALFGPAISDGEAGFIYTVSDVVEGSDTRQGWVLWVRAGAAEPIVIADEPEAGVGEVLGVIDDGTRYAVYTTVAGRTNQLRRAPLDGSTEVARSTTLLDDFQDGDAAADRIIMVGTEDGCSTFSVMDGSGTPVPFVGLPTDPCLSLDQATLSPDGRSVAYLDRTGDRNLLVVVSLDTGAVQGSVSLDTRKRIVAFDGSEVTLTGETAIDIASRDERQDAEPAEQYAVWLNSRLVLQVPGTGNTVTFDEARAADLGATPEADVELSEQSDRFIEYSAAGWTVAVQPDPEAAAVPVDLDAFGVTLRGLGPYVLGDTTQSIADESGHELMALGDESGCRSMLISPLRGPTADDVTLIVEEDRLAGIEFASSRFAFDGVTVGTPLWEARDRLADAKVIELDGATLLMLEIDSESTAEFRVTGGRIDSFSIAAANSCPG